MASPERPVIGILASGGGTTAEAVAKAVEDGSLIADLLVVHNNEAPGVESQKTLARVALEIVRIDGSTHPASNGNLYGAMGDVESQAVLDLFREHTVGVVVLLGYAKMVGGPLLDEYGFDSSKGHKTATDARMLNIHPGPMEPTTGMMGAQVHREVYGLYRAGKLNKTGSSLHGVDGGYDTGPSFRFYEVPILGDDTPDTIESKVRAVELDKVPGGLQEFLEESGVAEQFAD